MPEEVFNETKNDEGQKHMVDLSHVSTMKDNVWTVGNSVDLLENTLDEFKNKTNSAIKGIRRDIKSLVKADSYTAGRLKELDSMTYQLSNQFASHQEDIDNLDDWVSELKEKMELREDEIEHLDERVTKLTEIMEHMETLVEDNMKESDKRWHDLYFFLIPATGLISTLLSAIFTIIMFATH